MDILIDRKLKVFEWLKSLGDEIDYLIQSPLQAKFKIMMLMVYTDIFSQVWDLVQVNQNKKQKDRFLIWAKEFMFKILDIKDEQECLKIAPLDAEKLYEIRNSLLHYGGLPSFDIPVFISEIKKDVFLAKFAKEIREFYIKHPDIDEAKGIMVLCPVDIYRRFITGVINTISNMDLIMIKNTSQEETIIEKLYLKLMENCATPTI